MRDRDLETAAERAGLLTHWRAASGNTRRVAPETLRALLDVLRPQDGEPKGMPPLVVADAAKPAFSVPSKQSNAQTARIEMPSGAIRECRIKRVSDTRLQLNTRLPAGYHAVELGSSRFVVAAAPPRCFGVADAVQSRPALWGIAVQLYSLRRKNDLGYGDFTALNQFVASAAKHGAAAVALSPLHAMFGAKPNSYSPYSPSNRMFLNTLYADPTIIGANTRRSTLIDWPHAARLHRRLFEAFFKRFAAGEIAGAADFDEFRSRGGKRLFDHACFEALDESCISAKKPSVSSARARAFADEHQQRIVFQQFMQWRASVGLASAQSTARALGMPIGLIADLAVGVDPRGSECWSQPHDTLVGATIGAPPDALNAVGQNWGLTTFSPGSLESNGFAAFLSILRTAMRHAGGVRLDHVMSLMRLWLVPNGARAVDGAYLRYPFADLVRLVALESWRHRCIVIGEDLGTVPDDCRSRLSSAGILGLDVLPFMRDGKRFIPPARWRDTAVAMTSTHDMAPVAAWWVSRDLDWRRRLQLFGDLDEKTERCERDLAKTELARIAHLSSHVTANRIVDAAIQITARSPSPLVILPVEDLVGASEQPNLPGTIAGHPNWRRRYRDYASRLLDSSRVAARLKRIAHARKRAT